jgi:hypothetical protein
MKDIVFLCVLVIQHIVFLCVLVIQYIVFLCVLLLLCLCVNEQAQALASQASDPKVSAELSEVLLEL